MRKIRTTKRKRINRKIAYVISILFLFIIAFKVTMVDAGSNDSKLEKNRVDGIYAVTNIGGVSRIFYLNMYMINGRISYCIELGVDITSDIYNSDGNFRISNLTKEQVDYIRNVSYFGYEYGNHNDVYYYMGAQEIIWEYLSNVEIEWTNVMSVNGERIDIDNYKDEIISLVDNYYKGINLDGYSDGMDVNIGDEIVITDVNSNLKYYDVIDGEHCDAEIVDNKLYIRFKNDYVGQDVLVLKRKSIYAYDINLYYQGNSQKLISNGNINEEVKLNFIIIGKNINIQLKDSVDIIHNGQFSYLGIVYELFNEDYKYFGRFESDKNGKIIINNMPYGRYYIRGIGVNRAYYFDYVDNYFNFMDDSIIYLNVHPVFNTFKFLKLYGENEQLNVEKGVIFEIYNKDGTFYDEFITDENGVSFVSMPYGKYIVKQKTSSYGYSKVDDFLIEVTKKRDDIINYTLVDQAIKSNLIINSKDGAGNFVLEDGIFYKIKKDDDYLVLGGNSEFRSVDGVMMLPDKIGYGDYVVEIINDSINYLLDVDDLEFSINDSSNFVFRDDELWLELDVNYSVRKGNIKVNTYKEEIIYTGNNYYYDYVKNGDVELDLIVDEDIVVNNSIIYKCGDKISSIVTNSNGEYILNDIYFGKYCLIDKNGNKNCFEVLDDNNILVEIKEKLNKGSVNVLNLSSEMEYIMGTIMEFTNKNGQVVYIGSTNEEGIIKINDLVYGEYCFKQKSVNNGYLINDDKVCFDINNNELVNLEIFNKKVGKKLIELPNTLNDKESMKKLIILILIFVGGIVYKVFNKFN